MPIIKSAIKRARQAIVRRERNVGLKRDIKDANKALAAKPSAKGLSASQRAIDTAVKKGLISKNTAARRKSRLAREAKAAGVKLASSKTAPKAEAVKKPVAKKETATKTVKKAPAKKPAVKKTPKA